MRLVIVESPGQIRPLKTLLGADFLVRASFGHVPGLFTLAFSAELEAQLDRVARGELSRSQVLEAFYRGHLAPALEKAAGAARMGPSPNRDNLACSLPLTLEEDDR